jgi:DNA-binding XRE family transcriptional regulator
MLAHMKMRTIGESTEISITIPSRDAPKVGQALSGFMTLAGHKVRRINEDGEELFSSAEIFSDSHPGSRLHGLRVREGLTQKDMANKLGVRQHHVSEMEKGKRVIGLEMAKRISSMFDVSYKAFI